MNKIIYIANVRLPTEKAHGYQIMKMCEAFAACGAGVELVVPFRQNEIQSDPFTYWQVKKDFTITHIGRRDFLWYKFIPRKIAFLANALFFTINASIYIYTHNTFDIIYTRDREVAMLSMFFKRKFVWEIHFLPRTIFLYNFIFKRMYMLITITEHLKKFLIERGVLDKKIVVSPDAVDLALFDANVDTRVVRKNFNIPTDKFVVLYAGQLFQWKGVRTLISASRILPNNYMTVIVGGDSASIGSVQKDSWRNLIFIGQRPVYEIPALLKSADVLVSPNSGKQEISKHYTSPLKLFEYMASGVPMVVSRLPSLQEIVSDDDVFFFEPDSASDLARAIREVVEHQEDAKNRARHAKEKVKQYTWLLRAKRIYDILKNI